MANDQLLRKNERSSVRGRFAYRKCFSFFRCISFCSWNFPFFHQRLHGHTEGVIILDICRTQWIMKLIIPSGEWKKTSVADQSDGRYFPVLFFLIFLPCRFHSSSYFDYFLRFFLFQFSFRMLDCSLSSLLSFRLKTIYVFSIIYLMSYFQLSR